MAQSLAVFKDGTEDSSKLVMCVTNPQFWGNLYGLLALYKTSKLTWRPILLSALRNFRIACARSIPTSETRSRRRFSELSTLTQGLLGKNFISANERDSNHGFSTALWARPAHLFIFRKETQLISKAANGPNIIAVVLDFC